MAANPSQCLPLSHRLSVLCLLLALCLSVDARAEEEKGAFREGLEGLLVFEAAAAVFSLPAIYGPQEYGVLLGGVGTWLAVSGYGARGTGDDWMGPAFFLGLGAYNFLALDPDMPDGELYAKNLLAWNVLGAVGIAYLAATQETSSRYSPSAGGRERVRWLFHPGGVQLRVDF